MTNVFAVHSFYEALSVLVGSFIAGAGWALGSKIIGWVL